MQTLQMNISDTSSLEHDNAVCDNVQFLGYISAENWMFHFKKKTVIKLFYNLTQKNILYHNWNILFKSRMAVTFILFCSLQTVVSSHILNLHNRIAQDLPSITIQLKKKTELSELKHRPLSILNFHLWGTNDFQYYPGRHSNIISNVIQNAGSTVYKKILLTFNKIHPQSDVHESLRT